VLPIRAFDNDGTGTAFNIAKAIELAAVNNRVSIINMSFGLRTRSFAIDYALRTAFSRGKLLIASAGNKGSANGQYPASENDLVMAVAATDANDVKADFSNFGAYVDVTAPGVDIYGPYPGNRFGSWSGTSFATPFVAAEAALLYSTQPASVRRNPDTRQRVMQAIYESAVNIDANNPTTAGQLGRGRINVLGAVNAIRQ
jgi:subtilisin family serine protease